MDRMLSILLANEFGGNASAPFVGIGITRRHTGQLKLRSSSLNLNRITKKKLQKLL